MLSRWIPLEKDLVELEDKIAEVEELNKAEHLDFTDKIEELRAAHQQLLEQTFKTLTPWDRVQLARHPKRPYTLDYVNTLFTDFMELHGDRRFGDDGAVVAGLAKFDGRSVAVVGYQKAREVKERQRRNFGMPMPEGLRKAERVMKLAAKFGKPIITFVDTPGAACLIQAEERGISEAIAQNQMTMSQLRVPIIVVFIGEGASGGAIAIALGDRILMLEHAYYTVISPEGCASILWRDASKAADAAEALKITAQDAMKLGIADDIIPEPLGGAHRNPAQTAENIRVALRNHLEPLRLLNGDELVEQRYQKFRAMGAFTEPLAEETGDAAGPAT